MSVTYCLMGRCHMVQLVTEAAPMLVRAKIETGVAPGAFEGGCALSLYTKRLRNGTRTTIEAEYTDLRAPGILEDGLCVESLNRTGKGLGGGVLV
ncbi:hypothetical protein PIB30_048243 [Stylosanthes scabra]|uniref:Uncharacterized protein n=1 Tax=Stylosanthes scabra TaxID=79078 RepID=A0ABU6WKD6_9FABA|nr:hypothetical protein [Stylosanthes scabra]